MFGWLVFFSKAEYNWDFDVLVLAILYEDTAKKVSHVP